MLVHCRVTPSFKFAGTHLYTWAERGTTRVKCLAQEHNRITPARTRTWIINPSPAHLTLGHCTCTIIRPIYLKFWQQNGWKGLLNESIKLYLILGDYLPGHTLYTTNTSSSCSESVLTNIFGGVLGVGTSPSSVGPVINLKREKNQLMCNLFKIALDGCGVIRPNFSYSVCNTLDLL